MGPQDNAGLKLCTCPAPDFLPVREFWILGFPTAHMVSGMGEWGRGEVWLDGMNLKGQNLAAGILTGHSELQRQRERKREAIFFGFQPTPSYLPHFLIHVTFMVHMLWKQQDKEENPPSWRGLTC